MIHLRPIPGAPRKRCDTRALLEARSETHRKLKHEMEEKKISAVLVDKHNRHIRDQQIYRQRGAE